MGLGSASLVPFDLRLSPPRNGVDILFDSSSTSPGGRPPPADEAGIAETGSGTSPGASSGLDANQRESTPDLCDSDSSVEEDIDILFKRHRDFAPGIAWRRRQRREAREAAEHDRIKEEEELASNTDSYEIFEADDVEDGPLVALRDDHFNNDDEPKDDCGPDARLQYLENSVGKHNVDLMRELGVLDSVLDMVSMDAAMAMVITAEDGEGFAMTMDEFVETDIVLALDSGCCDHICDLADVPGYANSVTQSPGSQRGQRFIVDNGDRVPNQGQVKVHMMSKGDDGVLTASVFQIAEITRPLMSVSRICDQDMVCIFEKDHARIVDAKGNLVSRFERDGGLYTCKMKLRRPEPNNNGQPFVRPA